MFSCNCHQESPKMVLDPTTKRGSGWARGPLNGSMDGVWKRLKRSLGSAELKQDGENHHLQSHPKSTTPKSFRGFLMLVNANKFIIIFMEAVPKQVTLPIHLCSLQAIQVNAGLQVKTLFSFVWINAEYQNMRIMSRIVTGQLESVKPRRFLWCRRWWSTTFNSLVPFWPSLSQHWGTNRAFCHWQRLQCLFCVCARKGGEDFGLELMSKIDRWIRTGWWFSALDPELGGLERDLWPCEARAEGGPRMRALLGETMIE